MRLLAHKNKLHLIICAAVGSMFFSCTKDDPLTTELRCSEKCYLHLSHTKTFSGQAMSSSVEGIDYTAFDMLWLGGDLTNSTSDNFEVMSYVDSFFDVGNTNTLWTLGNHDYQDLNLIEDFTLRPTYYAQHRDGLTIVVLDTQDSLSSIVAEQKDFLYSVLDTVQNSSHLILLHHKLIWMYGNSILEPQINSVSNGVFGDNPWDLNPNNFQTDVYPKLLEVKNTGVEVICVGGDLGIQTKQFEHTTSDGIHYLASGIDADGSDNLALVFFHNPAQNILNWKFLPLSTF